MVAEKQAAEEFQQLVDEEIARHGLGDQPCIFAGCSERVLGGSKVCAKHTLGDTVEDVSCGCHVITPEIMGFLEGKTELEAGA